MSPLNNTPAILPPDQDLYIGTESSLCQLIEQLRSAPWIAIDTEFLRERTYHARLCLIQIASPNLLACIDSLAIEQLEPLRELIQLPGQIKILHAAFQDLEILYHHLGALPSRIFDTQVAAAFLGEGNQTGYGRLVSSMLHIDLNKDQTRTDWSQRPLTSKQIHYAGNDVRYLGTLYLRQRKALIAQGRLGWLEEDFHRLAQPDSYKNQPFEQWRRICGANRLFGKQLCALRALAAWREQEAQRLDRPRRWIIADDIILGLACRMPRAGSQMNNIRGMPGKVPERYKKILLRIAAEASQKPIDECLKPPNHKILTTEQEALVDLLMATLRIEASRHSISPSLLATRRDLESLVRDASASPVMKGWRGHLVGNAMQKILADNRGLRA